jgi:SAM-dependent methyltransferase
MKHIEELLPDLNIENTEMQCTMDESGCCIVASNDTERAFWDDKWAAGATGWDLSGTISEEFLNYFNSITNKSASILIPGCGNAHEAVWLFEAGFKNVFLLDITAFPLRQFHKRNPHFPEANLLKVDFFDHHEQYDLVMEQTFFCAIDPSLREEYVKHLKQILIPGGKMAGLLFGVEFKEAGPPFGGTESEYRKLFEPQFDIIRLEHCTESIPPRAGRELFIEITPHS